MAAGSSGVTKRGREREYEQDAFKPGRATAPCVNTDAQCNAPARHAAVRFSTDLLALGRRSCASLYFSYPRTQYLAYLLTWH